MARLEFLRVDLHLGLRASPDRDGISVTVMTSGTRDPRFLPADALSRWRSSGPVPMPDLAGRLDLARAILEWRRQVENARKSNVKPHIHMVLPRITLDITGRELDGIPWEAGFSSIADAVTGKALVVRVSPVRHRAESTQFTLPLRILHVEPGAGRSIVPGVLEVFGNHSPDAIAAAVQVRACSFDEIDGKLPHRDWPTAEVLHFDDYSALIERPELLLSTANPRFRGSLGWFSRLTDRLQTRLVVVECTTPAEAAAARSLGAALVAKGGPPVLVSECAEPGVRAAYFGSLYSLVIHDSPIDAAVGYAAADVHRKGGEVPAACLFAGAGREDALRVSSVGIALGYLADRLGNASVNVLLGDELPARDQLLGSTGPERSLRRSNSFKTITSTLADFRSNLDGYTFDLHESGGLLPIAETLRSVRRSAGVTGPVSKSALAPTPLGPRFVNSSLYQTLSGESLVKLDQEHARLTVGELCHLGVQIGPKDAETLTIGASALLEEYFQWTPEMKGVWVEIGVTGLDFEVIGDPVQELWLPREGASDTVYFAVKPRSADTPRLRFCLYFRQNVIQSFRLAAIVRTSAGEPDQTPAERAIRLASALDVPVTAVPDVGYLASLEYSLTTEIDKLPEHPERTLSLVANHLGDEAVITVKGPDLFEVRVNNEVKTHVELVRSAMDEVCTDRTGKNPQYQFNIGPANLNAGTEPILKEALKKLAVTGRDLYAAIFDQATRDKLRKTLAPERREIHVAHVLLENVIPWSAIYDEEYDPIREIDEKNVRVAHDVCLAALPSKDGSLPAQQCGSLPACPLHASRIEKRQQSGEPPLLRDTVVCPLHFWGFKHIIEIPPQQVKAGKDAFPQRDKVVAGATVQMVAGLNAALPSASQHATELDALARSSGTAAWKSKLYHRDQIRGALNDPDLDFIYFYCHARGGRNEPVKLPVLEFRDQPPGSTALTMKSADLGTGTMWSHHPLLFLNGCGTAGFSTDALSPFITAAVQDRGAAGAIGTEIPVWEYLAGDFSLRFAASFLKGVPAGEAMLLTRRALLAEYNPLGLIYTLYAVAGLTLTRNGA